MQTDMQRKFSHFKQDRQMDGQTMGWTYGQTDGQTNI